jgi:hypothetical protein
LIPSFKAQLQFNNTNKNLKLMKHLTNFITIVLLQVLR